MDTKLSTKKGQQNYKAIAQIPQGYQAPVDKPGLIPRKIDSPESVKMPPHRQAKVPAMPRMSSTYRNYQ